MEQSSFKHTPILPKLVHVPCLKKVDPDQNRVLPNSVAVLIFYMIPRDDIFDFHLDSYIARVY